MPASAYEITVMRSAYQKLDNMPIGFGIPPYDSDGMEDAEIIKYLYGDLRDVMRELKIKTLDGIEEMSQTELHIENRIVYHALRRFQKSSSIFFKFSTATDGKAIDKTSIYKAITGMINDYQEEWAKWRMSQPVGQFWTMSNTVKTSGEVESLE